MNVLGSGHVPGSWGTCPAPFMESEVAARLGLGEAETQEPQSPRSPAPLGWGRPSPQAGTGVSWGVRTRRAFRFLCRRRY